MPRSRAPLPAALACLLLGACTTTRPDTTAHGTSPAAPSPTYAENHRPQFHFSPPAYWMNDPNGLVWFDGEYHLFYQHNPHSAVWGPMHWGHAVSRDLVHWQTLPVAFAPDEDGEAWSGSIVVDQTNSSGLGRDGVPPMVALYTAHNRAFKAAGQAQPEHQNLAYSQDHGRTWRKYAGNPVLPNPGDQKNFRDPKVAWHAPSHRWVMALAEGDHTAFYNSPDLKNWHYLSTFGQGMGAHGGVWECPDLFPLTVRESGETRWVLLQSLNAGAPNGGSGTQYFVGDFDGTRFTPDPRFAADSQRQGGIWLDWGRDNYAVVSWSGLPATDGRRLTIGWMANWQDARKVPTAPWRGAMTVPRTLELHRLAAGYRLSAAPVRELETLRGTPRTLPARTIDGTQALDLAPATLSQSDMTLRFDQPAGAVRFGLLFSNARGEALRLGYDGTTGSYFTDRRQATGQKFSDTFATGIHTAPRTATGPHITLRLLMDAASLELFADDGQTVMTETFFPSARFDRVALFSEGGSTRLNGATLYPLHGIWPAQPPAEGRNPE
ncbi:glycoside hydrolase family 32 protein [Gluconacetobacter takamatsuzukensis]|uniref:Glycoside hydrolase family 32 protein n=1 Tax=Gluconacetobacter takamatsuzukensis TaxID=1286190 RepID=A0A7W4KEW0_9PROT|nr:glycoside hydrolase family 32 protein [Gluconacetobacter takamatsuzukensis]MBB2205623.1 glycoside hydrolase family 32 protein [Gluconacetobacter takamatsuzukensis]